MRKSIIVNKILLIQIRSKTVFDDDEWNLILKLPKKEYLIEDEKILLHQMIDIMYAFLYEYRAMDGDFSSESGWTINKLSATLSCYIEEEDLRKVIETCLRRALIYPIYRHFDLALKVRKRILF